MSKFLLLHCRMSGLCRTFGLCYLLLLHPHNTSHQHQILLLLPLIRFQIVILLRMIGDQKLCDGFTLEIAGHDGLQDSALRPTLGYISGSPEKSGQEPCGASTPEAFCWIKAEGWIRQPELGCKTQMLASVCHHI